MAMVCAAWNKPAARSVNFSMSMSKCPCQPTRPSTVPPRGNGTNPSTHDMGTPSSRLKPPASSQRPPPLHRRKPEKSPTQKSTPPPPTSPADGTSPHTTYPSKNAPRQPRILHRRHHRRRRQPYPLEQDELPRPPEHPDQHQQPELERRRAASTKTNLTPDPVSTTRNSMF
jgi:hypothetical protein